MMETSDIIKISHGKWWVDMEKEDGGYFVAYGGDDKDGESLAFCYPVANGDALANAHLLAAAPELYTTVKTVEMWLDKEEKDISPVSEYELKVKIREALAIANGESCK